MCAIQWRCALVCVWAHACSHLPQGQLYAMEVSDSFHLNQLKWQLVVQIINSYNPEEAKPQKHYLGKHWKMIWIEELGLVKSQHCVPHSLQPYFEDRLMWINAVGRFKICDGALDKKWAKSTWDVVVASHTDYTGDIFKPSSKSHDLNSNIWN